VDAQVLLAPRAVPAPRNRWDRGDTQADPAAIAVVRFVGKTHRAHRAERRLLSFFWGQRGLAEAARGVALFKDSAAAPAGEPSDLHELWLANDVNRVADALHFIPKF
jgi:hypothetical protein